MLQPQEPRCFPSGCSKQQLVFSRPTWWPLGRKQLNRLGQQHSLLPARARARPRLMGGRLKTGSRLWESPYKAAVTPACLLLHASLQPPPPQSSSPLPPWSPERWLHQGWKSSFCQEVPPDPCLPLLCVLSSLHFPPYPTFPGREGWETHAEGTKC